RVGLGGIKSGGGGMGKRRAETLERLWLETGASLWSAMEQTILQKLLPARAVQALVEFKQIIEDARAMLGGSFVERLVADAAAESMASPLVAQPPSAASEVAGEDEAASFDF